MERLPLVSVGLPVYNGAGFLRETVSSLLSQTCADFELIISDNASTDRTEDVCREVAAADSRVRYFRQPRNMGAPANWNFVVRQARARFFKWSSASDLCSQRFLAACLQPLLEDDSIVLCYGRTSYIDDENRPVVLKDQCVEALNELPSERFRHICLNLSLNNEQYGLMRRDALLKTRLDRPYPHGDLVLMAELALLGKFKLLPETLLLRRAAPGHWTGMMGAEELDALFWPGRRPKAPVLYLRRHLDYMRSALSSPVSWPERLRAAEFALRFAYWRRDELKRDLLQVMRLGRTPAGS